MVNSFSSNLFFFSCLFVLIMKVLSCFINGIEKEKRAKRGAFFLGFCVTRTLQRHTFKGTHSFSKQHYFTIKLRRYFL